MISMGIFSNMLTGDSRPDATFATSARLEFDCLRAESPSSFHEDFILGILPKLHY